MSIDPEPQKKSSLLRVLFAGTALVVAAAIGWFSRGEKRLPPAPAIPQASAPRSEPKNAAPETPGPAATNPLAADENELLRQLREKLPGSLGDVLNELGEIAKTRPALAIDLAQALGRTDQEKYEWVTNMMQQWADQDPQAAWQWLGQLSSARMNELAAGELTGVVLGTMAAHDPNMVFADLDTLLRQGNPSQSVSTPVAMHLGLQALVEHGDVDLARKAVEGWATDPLNFKIEAAAYETVAVAMAQTAPADAGAWLTSMPASDERNAAVSGFVANWAGNDPNAALQWAEALPPQEGRQAALERTVSDWIERYPTEITGQLSNFLSNTPANADADTLVEMVIKLSPVVQNDPQAALQWTSLISDPQQREAYEERTALQWGSQNSTAAINYVQSSPTIPADRKPVLIQQIQSQQFAPPSGK